VSAETTVPAMAESRRDVGGEHGDPVVGRGELRPSAGRRRRGRLARRRPTRRDARGDLGALAMSARDIRERLRWRRSPRPRDAVGRPRCRSPPPPPPASEQPRPERAARPPAGERCRQDAGGKLAPPGRRSPEYGAWSSGGVAAPNWPAKEQRPAVIDGSCRPSGVPCCPRAGSRFSSSHGALRVVNRRHQHPADRTGVARAQRGGPLARALRARTSAAHRADAERAPHVARPQGRVVRRRARVRPRTASLAARRSRGKGDRTRRLPSRAGA
jgi:hypothetical protein